MSYNHPAFKSLEEKQAVIDFLEGVGTTVNPSASSLHDDFQPELGLCFHIIEIFNPSILRHVKSFFEDWPLYSGYKKYPVPHPIDRPDIAYDRVRNLYAGDKYGDNRRSLALYLAERLREED